MTEHGAIGALIASALRHNADVCLRSPRGVCERWGVGDTNVHPSLLKSFSVQLKFHGERITLPLFESGMRAVVVTRDASELVYLLF